MEKEGKASSFPAGNLSPGPHKRRLFRNLGPREQRNLALAAIAGFYLILIANNLLTGGFFVPFGLDFIVFYSAGYVGGTVGWNRIYDVGLLSKVQASFVPALERLALPHPFLYLPVFAIPFRLLALLPPVPSFLLWIFLNLLAMIYYLRFLMREASLSKEERGVLIMLLLSFPVFHNFSFGQIEVWLLICVGEFMRAFLGGKPWRAGVWLAGLLLKPQTLILIIPSLLLRKEFKVVGGFVSSSLALLTLSTLMSDFEGIRDLLALWFSFRGGAFITLQKCMMNWRAIQLHLSSFTSPATGWTVTGIGMVLTAALAFYLWIKNPLNFRENFAIALLGTLAATMTLAWHSHFHMGMLLLPPLIYLIRIIPASLLDVWVFAPPAFLFFTYFAGALIRAAGHALPEAYGCLILGSCLFFLNLSLLLWCVRQKRKAIGCKPIAHLRPRQPL